MRDARSLDSIDLTWHDTPQLWVAYRGCGCVECPKGFGKTRDEAVAALLESELDTESR